MIELLLVPFFQRSLVVGLLLGIAMALLGVFVVLRRLSFFSDAIGHSALTGIAIGLLLAINPFISALVFCLLVALGIVAVRTRTRLSLDTVLGIFFAAAVSLGVILVQFTPGYQADLFSFLFGDILTVSTVDLFLSSLITLIVLFVMLFAGKAFISITFNPDLAKTEGIPVTYYELVFLLVLAGTIALAIKAVGITLVTALLVIPAATAQNISRSLTSLFGISVVVGIITIVSGLLFSVALQTPSGPTIVLAGSLLFGLSFLFKSHTAR